jgi:histidine ammonia-lyase
MTYEQEKYLFDKIKNRNKNGYDATTVRDIIDEMVQEKIIDRHKQAWATLNKWSDKGIYDYGVTLDLGWLVNNKIDFSEVRRS